jgi:hypothetical protein
MTDIQVSLVASAVRTTSWLSFYDSLKGNNIKYEVIFVGNRKPDFKLPENFTYIYANVKPAQCYEIGFRAAKGELVHWTADDADYGRAPNRNGLEIGYNTYKKCNNYKMIIAMRPYEDGSANVWKFHHFFGGKDNTPVMAPFGLMSKQFMNEIGGYDKAFIGGQSENDLVMRAFEAGGSVHVDLEAHLWVNHRLHENPNKFRAYYKWDREVLENAWVPTGYGSYNDRSLNWDQVQISATRLRPFDPFVETKDWTTVSQGPKGDNVPWN